MSNIFLYAIPFQGQFYNSYLFHTCQPYFGIFYIQAKKVAKMGYMCYSCYKEELTMNQDDNIAKRLKYAVEASALSYVELEKKTGIAKSSIQRYTSGKTKKIPIDAVEAISNAIGVSLSWIMGWDEEKLRSPEMTTDAVVFPIIGTVAAGYDELALEDWSGETVSIPTEYLRGHSKEEFLVLSVHGDSMYPLYINGDKVLILKQSTLNRSGEIGAVLYGGDNATLKKVEYVEGEDWMKLIPVNPEYLPKTIEGSDLEECRILGVPRLLIREIN